MQLDAVRTVFERPGPFVTVHAEVGRGTEDARQQLDARWTTIRHALEKQDVDAALVDKIGERLRENHHVPGEARMTIVGCGDDIVFEAVQAGHSTSPEVTEVAPLPDLSGWLAHEARQFPFGLAVVDREGGDVEFYTAINEAPAEHQEVHGETLHIQKVPQGDWAHRKFQQGTENVWKGNAEQVAEALRSGVRRLKPRVVVLAGDEHARSNVAAALDGLETPVVHVTAGGRGAGASQEALWGEVAEVVARFEADQDEQVAEQVLERSGQGAGAASGLEPVLDALVKGQVERLVVDLEAARAETVDASRPGLALPDAAAGQSLPADRVLVAVGANTDAQLSLLPGQRTKGEGVAALLRWDDSAAPADTV
jgi:hypothetical protein